MTVEHNPDNWVVFYMDGDESHYRVLAGWSGGYLDGNAWRINSGIVRAEEDKHFFYFYGSSGSCYKCHKNAYLLRINNSYIWNQLQEIHGNKVKLMDKDTNWLEMDWGIE